LSAGRKGDVVLGGRRRIAVASESQHRNSLWMSDELRYRIANCHLMIFGCGGLGSLFAIKAAHLGFGNLVLVDPDVLETSNLNRFIIGSVSDIGRPKAAVLQSYLAQRFPDINCRIILESFPSCTRSLAFTRNSVCIGCLDDVKPRIELDIFTRCEKVPLIDLGCGFVIERGGSSENRVLSAGGQILFSRRDGPCLNCLGFAMDATAHSYYLTTERPDASSLLLNAVVVSLSLECLLKELVGDLGEINRVEYDRGSVVLYKKIKRSKPWCAVCGVNASSKIKKVGNVEWLYSGLKGQCKIV
jgi:ThiF family protein